MMVRETKHGANAVTIYCANADNPNARAEFIRLMNKYEAAGWQQVSRNNGLFSVEIGYRKGA